MFSVAMIYSQGDLDASRVTLQSRDQDGYNNTKKRGKRKGRIHLEPWARHLGTATSCPCGRRCGSFEKDLGHGLGFDHQQSP